MSEELNMDAIPEAEVVAEEETTNDEKVEVVNEDGELERLV